MSTIGFLVLILSVYISNAKSNDNSDSSMQNPFNWMMAKQLFELKESVKSNGQAIQNVKENVNSNSQAIQNAMTKISKLSKSLQPEKICPQSWVSVLGHCYLFGQTIKPWESAKADCERKQSYLIQLESAEENAKVAAAFSTKGFFNMNIWLGATNLSGQWRWNHGHKHVTWFYWRNGEPNNVGGNENCLDWHFYPHEYYKWNDGNCQVKLYYICERN